MYFDDQRFFPCFIIIYTEQLLDTPIVIWINFATDVLFVVDMAVTFYRAYVFKETRSGTFLQV